MALSDIIQSINDEAKLRIAELGREAEVAAAKNQQEWEQELARRRSEIRSQLQAEADNQAGREIMQLKVQAQREVLQTKQRLLDKVFTESLKQLEGLADAQYIDWLVQAIGELPSDDGELVSTTGKTAQLKKAISRSGRKFGPGSEEVAGSGGFIFRSENLAADSRFEKILENRKDELRVELGQILFNAKNE